MSAGRHICTGDASSNANRIKSRKRDDYVIIRKADINPVIFGIKKKKAEELGFVGNDVRTKDILDCIINLATRLGMHTLTEGVETQDEADFLNKSIFSFSAPNSKVSTIPVSANS